MHLRDPVERRYYARWPGAADVWLDAESDPPVSVQGLLENLSMTGLCLRGLHPLVSGTRVAVRLSDEDGHVDSGAIVAQGRVVDSATGSRPGSWHLIHVCFTRAEESVVNALVTNLELRTRGG